MKKLDKRCAFKCLMVFILCMAVLITAGFIEKHVGQSTTAVNVVEEKTLIPGGQSVGIKMDVKGVLIVGLEELETENDVVSPGYDAGLTIGDMILSVNGIEVSYPEDVEKILNQVQGTVELEILRKDKTMKVEVTPVKSYSDGTYRLGVWVKEKIAGIGTLTFYDPDNDVYAALGHGIYESKTKTLLEADDGQLLNAEVQSVQEGKEGTPGEIRGIFSKNSELFGNIEINSKYGIYAKGSGDVVLESEAMVMAVQSQIKEGDAYILTTIEGSQVEAFDIKITKVNKQTSAADKGLEIEVTDERLLANCGGIVQGMSGSPIIQDGRIVGAVTHVMIDDPTKGYGIFAEWMVEEAEKAA